MVFEEVNILLDPVFMLWGFFNQLRRFTFVQTLSVAKYLWWLNERIAVEING